MNRGAAQLHRPFGGVVALEDACDQRAVGKSADRAIRQPKPTILPPNTPGTNRMISNWPFGE